MNVPELQTIVAELERLDRERERIDGEHAALTARLREFCFKSGDLSNEGAASGLDLDLSDLIRPNQAEDLFGRCRSWLYRRAKENPMPAGFSYRAENGDYLYSRSRLELFIKRNPPRERRRKGAAEALRHQKQHQ